MNSLKKVVKRAPAGDAHHDASASVVPFDTSDNLCLNRLILLFGSFFPDELAAPKASP